MAERKSNFELYRIVCIMLIVIMHTFGTGVGQLNTYVGIGVNVIGNIGVTGFILLSGYFKIKLKPEKLIKLDIMIIVMSLLSFVTMYGLYGQASGLGVKDLITCFIPIISHKYWFLSAYFVVSLLSPFINEYIEKASKKQLEQLIMMLVVVFLILPTVFGFDQTGDGGKGILNMITAYVIGRYIGIYGNSWKVYKASTGKLLGMLIGVLTVNYGLNFVYYELTGNLANYYARDNSILTMAEAILIFIIFTRINVQSKLINVVAANVVCVYVLEDTIKSVIRYFYDYTEMSQVAYYLGVVVIVSVITFVIGCIIEQLRKLVFKKPEDKCVGWIVKWVLTWKKQ